MVQPQLPTLDPIHHVLAPKLSATAFPDLNPKVVTKREAVYMSTKSAHSVKLNLSFLSKQQFLTHSKLHVAQPSWETCPARNHTHPKHQPVPWTAKLTLFFHRSSFEKVLWKAETAVPEILKSRGICSKAAQYQQKIVVQDVNWPVLWFSNILQLHRGAAPAEEAGEEGRPHTPHGQPHRKMQAVIAAMPWSAVVGGGWICYRVKLHTETQTLSPQLLQG